MNLFIEENGCKDQEITILDTRLPYFYAKVRELFPNEPEEVKIVIVRKEEDIEENCVCTNGNSIYIYEPSLIETATDIGREHFYEILCQELVYLFYQKNKLS